MVRSRVRTNVREMVAGATLQERMGAKDDGELWPLYEPYVLKPLHV